MSGGIIEFFESESKHGDPEICFTEHEVRNLGITIVTLLRYITESWSITSFGEKQLRWAMDELSKFHDCEKLGQKRPAKLNVRLSLPSSDLIRIDLLRVKQYYLTHHPDEDVVFDVRVVIGDTASGESMAFLIPWDEFGDEPDSLELKVSDLTKYQSPVLRT